MLIIFLSIEGGIMTEKKQAKKRTPPIATKTFTGRLEQLIFTLVTQQGYTDGGAITLLAQKAKVTEATIYNWRKDPQKIEIAHLISLAQGMGVSTDWLLGLTDEIQTTEPLDNLHLLLRNTYNPTIFIDRQEYEAKRDDIIQSAQKLWIVNRTGSMFAGAASSALTTLTTALEREPPVHLRVMLPDPKNRSAVNIVAMGRAESPGDTKIVKNHITEAIEKFQNFIHHDEASELVTIPYVVPAVIYLSDPGSSQGKALILMVTFRQLVTKAPAIYVEEATNKELFNWFYEDILRMWKTFGGKLE